MPALSYGGRRLPELVRFYAITVIRAGNLIQASVVGSSSSEIGSNSRQPLNARSFHLQPIPGVVTKVRGKAGVWGMGHSIILAGFLELTSQASSSLQSSCRVSAQALRGPFGSRLVVRMRALSNDAFRLRALRYPLWWTPRFRCRSSLLC